MQPIRIWDLPTRLFHWTLAALVIGLLVTANVGGNAMVWHMRFGYGVLSLVVFRLLWGFVGGRWSRFASFVTAPRTVWRYLRGQVPDPVGHSPVGALSVLAMLAALAVQASAGLFADDDIAFAGPLASKVSSDAVSNATWFHTAVGKWFVIGLVLLHLGAIAYYTLRRRKVLVRPMLSGDKTLEAHTPASQDTAWSRLLAVAVFALSAGAVTALVRWGG